MCGIIGYAGDRDTESILLVGLERLSYRGYDSSGIATVFNGELSHWKKPGKIHELEDAVKNLTIKGQVGIGHTRWATHGEPNEINAHPHLSSNQKIALVHNGIIENYATLKTKLQSEGFIFRSQTDSEVIVHMIEYYLKNNTLAQAVEKAVQELIGTYAIAVVAEASPEEIVVVKKDSPLILGLGKSENIISSDINAIIPHTKEVIYLEDNDLAVITKGNVTIKKVGGETLERASQTITWDAAIAEKSGYDHFMLKEIHEQPTVIRNIISKTINENNELTFKHIRIENQQLAALNRFIIQACGTSWHAGLLGKNLMERYAKVLTEVDISSEFRYRSMLGEGNELVIAISQSGETADTLACIREAKKQEFKILSFVNVKGSSIDRDSDAVIYTHAGQEVGVASTKNFLAQIVCFYLFTIYLGRLRWTIEPEEATEMINALKRIPDYIEAILSQSEKIHQIAKKYANSKQFIFIGRGINYPSALEGALKLKEISYIHATGYPAGELKHGPIALIDEELPVVCLCPKSYTYDKMVSNIQEVRSRKGKTIVIATEGDEAIKEYADDIITIPDVPEDLSPVLLAVPMQLLAYYTALELGCNVDQPRNLAKSVTVE